MHEQHLPLWLVRNLEERLRREAAMQACLPPSLMACTRVVCLARSTCRACQRCGRAFTHPDASCLVLGCSGKAFTLSCQDVLLQVARAAQARAAAAREAARQAEMAEQREFSRMLQHTRL